MGGFPRLQVGSFILYNLRYFCGIGLVVGGKKKNFSGICLLYNLSSYRFSGNLEGFFPNTPHIDTAAFSLPYPFSF
jgi:hypothetical protein